MGNPCNVKHFCCYGIAKVWLLGSIKSPEYSRVLAERVKISKYFSAITQNQLWAVFGHMAYILALVAHTSGRWMKTIRSQVVRFFSFLAFYRITFRAIGSVVPCTQGIFTSFHKSNTSWSWVVPKCLVLEKILYENVEFKEEN